MRIAVIAPPWLPVPPPAYGGTERVIDVLCRALQAAGHDLMLFTTGESTCPVERRWVFETARRTDGATPVSEMTHVIGAYDAVRQWRADIVHDHTLFGPLYAERFPDLRVVTTNHGPFDGDLGPIYRVLAQRTPVIAISHHQAAAARVTPIAAVIHHGVDLDQFPMGGGCGGYALFLGRMCPEKNVDGAIRIARRAGWPLRIAAKLCEPAEYEYFRSEVEPLLGGEIEYIGEVGGTDKLRLLGEAGCLLNPIAWPEPFGMVMIEALACGTPVVATPRGAATEIVDHGETGWLASGESNLAKAMGDIAQLDRTACRAAAKARFSARRMAAEHADLFRRSVGLRRPATAAPALAEQVGIVPLHHRDDDDLLVS